MKKYIILLFISYNLVCYSIGLDINNFKITFQNEISLLNSQVEYSKAEKIYLALDSIIKNEYNLETKIFFDIEKLKIFKKFNKYAQGLGIALKLENSKSLPLNCIQEQYVLNYLSIAMVDINNYKKAINYLQKIKKTSCFEYTLYNIINYKISELYIKNDENEKALKVLKDYITNLIQKKDSALLIGAYNQQGLITKKIGMYDFALDSYFKSINLIKQTNNRKSLEPILCGNIGFIYRIKGDYKKAYSFLEEDSRGSLSINEITSYLYTEIELAKIDFDLKKYKKSVTRLESIYSNYSNANISIKIMLYEELAKNYGILNNTTKALSFFQKHSYLKDSLVLNRNDKYESLINEYSKAIYINVTEKYKVSKELAKRDLSFLKKEKKYENQRNYFLISILLLIILISFIFFRKSNNTKNKNKIIIQNNLKLKEQDLELKSAQKKILEIQIIDNNKNINSMALELSLKKKFSESLINKLNKLENISSSELRNIELYIQNELDLKSSRAILQNEIKSIGTIFFNELNNRHSHLTDADLKLCSMIVLNLSNKEIAISKNITTNSVKISKNRLKKKLNLLPINNLKEYLEKLM